jgi:small subunit ribosomal protein S7
MRKGKAPIRPTVPDSKFQSTVVTKFINGLMLAGKKAVARKTFYDALTAVEEKTSEKGIDVFNKAIEQASPSIDLRKKNVRGATRQVPVEVRPARKRFYPIKWLITAARNRSEKTMVGRLTAEFIAASQGEGNAVKKKKELHKMGESNRAFAHLR